RSDGHPRPAGCQVSWSRVDSGLCPEVLFFQAEDGIRNKLVTGVQTCALPISDLAARPDPRQPLPAPELPQRGHSAHVDGDPGKQIGRASCRERVYDTVGAVPAKTTKATINPAPHPPSPAQTVPYIRPTERRFA